MVDGPLHVLDRQERRIWKSTSKRTAHERDFHAVDMGSENDRMVIEKKLAECEGKWALVLKTALQEHVLPKDESIGDLLAFVSFMAVRVPRIRSQASDFVDRASKSQLRATFATNVGRDHFRSVIKEQITSLPLTEQRNIRQLLDDDPNLDKFAEFVQNEEYTVSYGQTWDVRTMSKMTITLLPILGQRNWAVSLLADDAPVLLLSLLYAHSNCEYGDVGVTGDLPLLNAHPGQSADAGGVVFVRSLLFQRRAHRTSPVLSSP